MTHNTARIIPFQPAVPDTIGGSKLGWRQVEGKGRGVFARSPIAKGEVVEVAPVIPMAAADVPEGGAPDGYVLEWDAETEGAEHALVLGYIMLYNHSRDPNLAFESDYEAETITATATRDIATGEELTWNYNCAIWFDVEE